MANLDRISEITASATGVSAKTREVVERAESAVGELQLLASLVGKQLLSLAVRAGRWGPTYDADELIRLQRDVLGVLDRLRVSTADQEGALDDIRRYTKFDYYHAIMGGSHIPTRVSPETMKAWRELRDRRIHDVTGPDEVRAFLVRHNLLTPALEQYLQDYEHCCRTSEHRRPDAWRERSSWGHLEGDHAPSKT